MSIAFRLQDGTWQAAVVAVLTFYDSKAIYRVASSTDPPIHHVDQLHYAGLMLAIERWSSLLDQGRIIHSDLRRTMRGPDKLNTPLRTIY
jgi:hypothetical protein